MRTVVAVWLAAIALAVVAAGSCSVEHRSGALVCDRTEDCPDGRLCQDGYCIFTGPIDAAVDSTTRDGRPDAFACPEACTSCERQSMTCNIDCGLTNCTNSSTPIKCPAGWNCVVACSTNGSCRGLDCTEGESCTATCKGNGSCRDVKCGPGRCDFTCSGEQSCRSVDCDASCGCDVRCENLTSCPLPNNCPFDADVCNTFDNGCTTSRIGCDTCL